MQRWYVIAKCAVRLIAETANRINGLERWPSG